jgi:hypothetical protein
MTTIVPNLFVKNISKNITKHNLWNVFNNYGFGVIDNIFIRPRNNTNNAVIIYKKWNIEDTVATRMILESGRCFTIVPEQFNETWKVSIYNKNMDMFGHLFADRLK